MEQTELEQLVAELTEANIRYLQEIRRLNNELDEYFMDRELLAHLVDDTTIEDE